MRGSHSGVLNKGFLGDLYKNLSLIVRWPLTLRVKCPLLPLGSLTQTFELLLALLQFLRKHFDLPVLTRDDVAQLDNGVLLKAIPLFEISKTPQESIVVISIGPRPRTPLDYDTY